MPRIRTIKPEFFSDPDLVGCSFAARLAFIGLWTHADREGRLKDDPRRLKLTLFPGDTVKMDALLEELAAQKFILRYEVDGQRFIQIRTFTEHQQPHIREAPSTIPAPCQHRASPEKAVLSPEKAGLAPCEPVGREGMGKVWGKEGMGKEGESKSADADRALPATLLEAWNTHTTPPIPRCRDVNGQRAIHAKSRLRERPLEEWVAVMQRIEASTFCRGENDRAWVATFDWLLRPDTATRVLEGKYDNRPVPVRKTPKEREAESVGARFLGTVTP